MPKTLTRATKDGKTRAIVKSRYGWNLPPEEGPGAYVGGTNAYSECVETWREHGWSVERVPNPYYKPALVFESR